MTILFLCVFVSLYAQNGDPSVRRHTERRALNADSRNSRQSADNLQSFWEAGDNRIDLIIQANEKIRAALRARGSGVCDPARCVGALLLGLADVTNFWWIGGRENLAVAISLFAVSLPIKTYGNSTPLRPND